MARSTLRGPTDLVEGFYLSHVVYHLHRSGILERMATGATAEDVAGEYGYDSWMLGALLEYVHQRSDILRRHGRNGYSLNPAYASYRRLGFHLDKLIGAYGPPLTRLEEALRSANASSDLVDRNALTRAFSTLNGDAASVLMGILREWGVTSLLDLGCGPGTLLIELAAADPRFRGLGIDANPAMYAVATERVESAGVGDAVRIVHGDVRNLPAHLPQDELRTLEAIHGGSVLNEFFSSDGDEAVELVAALRQLMPGRLFFVSDYYGKLGKTRRVSSKYCATLLQDVAQTISGQGVPPPDIGSWAEVYQLAGAELVHAYEGDNAGIAWFVHVVRL